MAESSVKDKPAVVEKSGDDKSEAELRRELIEAMASAYFGACRKLAKILNRRGR